jgi:hypothetical protein
MSALAGRLHDIRAFIHKYVHVSSAEATLIAAWIGVTHALEAFDFCAYIHVSSPLPECGKSRLLEVLEALVAKPWFTARVSAAVLMRKVDQDHPTLLLDESDAAFSADEQYSEALRGLLNAGCHRTGKASVCVGQGANLTFRDFSVFGPKAIAGIGRLPSTVESRSIPIVMKRRTKTEWIEKWRRRDAWQTADGLRERLATTLASELDRLRPARPDIPDGLSDRAEDVLEPLFAIADLAGGEWPEAVRDAAVRLMGQAARAAREADQNLPLELLTDIRDIFTAFPARMAFATKFILQELAALEDRPWSTFGKNEKGLTGHRLARLLKGFGIRPARTLREGAETFKGYDRASFEDAFARYLDSKASQTSQTNKTGPESQKTKASHDPAVTDSKPANHLDKHCVVTDVTLSNPDHEDGACCEGGPLQLRCKLCRQSPTYWQAGARPN